MSYLFNNLIYTAIFSYKGNFIVRVGKNWEGKCLLARITTTKSKLSWEYFRVSYRY